MLGIPEQVAGTASGLLGQVSGVPRTPEEQFGLIFIVFTSLGTLVGIVVIGYTLLNAYKYRDGTGKGDKADVTRPTLGEIPSGSGGGKKLFVSFSLSAIIVLGLIIWTYSALLYVENKPDEREPDLTVEVVGQQFSWEFIYPNGHTEVNELVVPEDSMIGTEVRTADVFHNFGVPEFRVKADAMPGHTTETWFVTEEPETVSAHCYELCGAGHSRMDAVVNVTDQETFEEWYAQTDGDGNEDAGGNETAAADDQPATDDDEMGDTDDNETAETDGETGTDNESVAGNETAAADNVTAAGGNESAAMEGIA